MDPFVKTKEKLSDMLKLIACRKCSKLPKENVWMLSACQHKYCTKCFKTLDLHLKSGEVKKCTLCSRLSPANASSLPDLFTTTLLQNLRKFQQEHLVRYYTENSFEMETNDESEDEDIEIDIDQPTSVNPYSSDSDMSKTKYPIGETSMNGTLKNVDLESDVDAEPEPCDTDAPPTPYGCQILSRRTSRRTKQIATGPPNENQKKSLDNFSASPSEVGNEARVSRRSKNVEIIKIKAPDGQLHGNKDDENDVFGADSLESEAHKTVSTFGTRKFFKQTRNERKIASNPKAPLPQLRNPGLHKQSMDTDRKTQFVSSIGGRNNSIVNTEAGIAPLTKPVVNSVRIRQSRASGNAASVTPRTNADGIPRQPKQTACKVKGLPLSVDIGSNLESISFCENGRMAKSMSNGNKQISKSARIRNLSSSSETSSGSTLPSIKMATPESPLTPSILNKRNEKGETQLHIAARTGQLVKLMRLLEMSADINAEDFAGWTPLHEGITGKTPNALEVVDTLLRHGSLVNVAGGLGHTPLHEAARVGRLDMVNLLLSYGALKDIPNDNGLLPVDVAKTREVLDAINNYRGPYKREQTVKDAISISRLRGSKSLVFFTYPVDLNFLNELNGAFRLKTTDKFTRDVTHIIFDVKPNGLVPLTLNYLYGMLTGAWLLSSDWLTNSLSGKRLTNPEAFEIGGYVKGSRESTGKKLRQCVGDGSNGSSGTRNRSRINRERKNPGLFQGISFYIYKNTAYDVDGLKLSKNELGICIRLADGEVLNREPNPDGVNPLDNLVRFHAKEPSHQLVLTSHLILFGDRNEPPKKHNLEHVKTLRVDWLIESILNFSLCDTSPFLV